MRWIWITVILCALVQPLELAVAAAQGPDDPAPANAADWRNIRTGWVIPSEDYSDQPYVVITRDGNWLCVLTTGKGPEGSKSQHVIATISADNGVTWSNPINIEPGDGPEASWVVPLITPSGRVYAFYDYNGDRVSTLNDKPIRADMLGWYAYKYSDDNGHTWSRQRYRLPVRLTRADLDNDWLGQTQMFWGIAKPVCVDGTVYLAFSKIGKHVVDKTEGWLFRSPNIMTEQDAGQITWDMLPEGENPIQSLALGSVQEEHNLVPLSDGSLFCMFRTTTGHPAQSYSRDGGRTWREPVPATYTPGGRLFKNPRACPRVWRAQNGKYLFWFHNHSGKTFAGRNPVWISGGVEKDGCIRWSQPEILFYDEAPGTRISYPDLIEQDDKYWITETQKSISRVHMVDATLLDGLWRQGVRNEIIETGLVLSMRGQPIEPRQTDMPQLPKLSGANGFSVDLWLRLGDISNNQIILDSRDNAGKGLAVSTTTNGTVQIEFCNGSVTNKWDCDSGLLKTDAMHHITFIVEGGPRLVLVVVDGAVCDGGQHRQYGWNRFDSALNDLNGSCTVKIAPTFKGQLLQLRIYNRALRVSEAISNYLAGS